MKLSFPSAMEVFLGNGHWSEGAGAAGAAAAWSIAEQSSAGLFPMPTSGVYMPLPGRGPKRLVDMEELDFKTTTLPTYSEVRQSASQIKRRKEVLTLESEGCTYSGAFFKDTLTGFGSIVYPQGDRFGLLTKPSSRLFICPLCSHKRTFQNLRRSLPHTDPNSHQPSCTDANAYCRAAYRA